MDAKTRGAWIIHHTDKLRQVKHPENFENILVAGKSGQVLSAIAATDEAELPLSRVRSLAKANGVNQLELDSVLGRLEARQLIQRDGEDVQVIGVTTSSILQHTARLLDDLQPSAEEEASIQLAELASARPMSRDVVAERLGDEHELAAQTVDDLLFEAEGIGFVDAEGRDKEKLYFNGNLFRREAVAKTQRVLESLSPDERRKLGALEQELLSHGCITISAAERIVGTDLARKANAIGLFDVHGVENEKGTTLFVTRPGAFSKFGDPFHDDALDMAKALVACFAYGMTQRSAAEGRIRMPQVLIGKLVAGREIGGPAPAIGQDYRALEYKGVVKVRRAGGNWYMRLLKRDIGELALAVLTSGDASHEAVTLPGAAVARYVAPEHRRVETRRQVENLADNKQTKRSVENMLRALREQ